MASNIKKDEDKKSIETKQAKERAKQIEKMMEDRDTPLLIRWVYSNRGLLTIFAIAIVVITLAAAIIFGVRKTNADEIGAKYINVYKILKEMDEKTILEIDDNKLAGLKSELTEVIDKGKNTLFKTYEYRLSNYYMGIIWYRLKNYDDKTGAVACFKEAYSDKASPFSDYAYFNVGKCYEQEGFIKFKEGKTDDANKIYEKAISHYTNMKKEFPNSFLSIRAIFQAAILYEELGKYDEAKKLYEEIKNTPEYKAVKDSSFMNNTDEQIKLETESFVNRVDSAIIRLGIISKVDVSSSKKDSTTPETDLSIPEIDSTIPETETDSTTPETETDSTTPETETNNQ